MSDSKKTSSVGPRAARLALILAAGLAVTLPLGGCDGDDATAAAIETSKRRLQALAPGVPSQYRVEVFNDVVSTLKPLSSKGSKSQSATASLLIAQAQAGLAEGPAAEASRLEREALNRIMAIQADLSQWYNLNAQGDGAASYNPAAELAEIDQLVKQRQEQRVGAQNEKSKVDSTVAQLREQAKAKVEQARAKREQAGALQSQVANQTAVQGEETLKRAHEIGRQGDALEVEGSMLEARAAKIAPQSVAIQLEIDRLTDQLALLDAARADVQTRAQTARANAAAARASATKAAAVIKEQFTQLESLRSGELAQQTAAAQSGYESAASSASGAMSQSPTNAQMAAGVARHALGDVLWTKAHGLSSYANLLETLAAAQPPLPESQTYASKAAEARAGAKEALDAATEAYTAANEAYQSSGSSLAPERIERVNASLAKIVKATSGGAKDIRSQPSEGGGDAAPSGEPAAAADPDSPQATLQAIIDAQKNGAYSDLVNYIQLRSDVERQFVSGFLRADGAMKAKFGKGMEGMANQGGMGGTDLRDIENITAADFQFAIEGDSATATPPEGEPLKLVRVDGKWLLANPMDQTAGDPNMAAMAQAMMPALGKVADEFAAEVESGKYTSYEAAAAAFQQKMAAMVPAGTPGGGR